MIISSIYADDSCFPYPKAIQRAVEYLKSRDFTKVDPGEYPIEGKLMYAKVFDITSKAKEEIKPEIHKEYIDVQFWVSGREYMGFAPKQSECEAIEKYPEKDLYFVKEAEEERLIKAETGDYMVLFPNDIHRPGVAAGQPETYRKVVVKVSMELLN